MSSIKDQVTNFVEADKGGIIRLMFCYGEEDGDRIVNHIFPESGHDRMISYNCKEKIDNIKGISCEMINGFFLYRDQNKPIVCMYITEAESATKVNHHKSEVIQILKNNPGTDLRFYQSDDEFYDTTSSVLDILGIRTLDTDGKKVFFL